MTDDPHYRLPVCPKPLSTFLACPVKTADPPRDNRGMARIGYARVSTLDQRPEMQTEALAGAGCERVFTDHGVSGARASRPELDACLAYLRRGDTLTVWKLDRLGRSVSHLVHVVEDLRGRGVQFVSLTEGFDTTTPAGRLLFHILAALAEMERELIRERTLAGIARAQAEGRMGGRRTVMGPERIRVASAMLAEGRPVSEVARVLGVGRATLYRALPIGTRRMAS
jgi:DNA invertase Pin-like site-specific DNA recombinase